MFSSAAQSINNLSTSIAIGGVMTSINIAMTIGTMIGIITKTG